MGAIAMKAFGEVAIQATELVRSGACRAAPEAWELAGRDVLQQSASLQDKSCPKGAYLGLCEEGMVIGVPAGDYTRSKDNKGYAVRALKLLQEEPALANIGPSSLWKHVLGGMSKTHNSQMDVVLALWHSGLLTTTSPDA
jgi:hypothetical protein